ASFFSSKKLKISFKFVIPFTLILLGLYYSLYNPLNFDGLRSEEQFAENKPLFFISKTLLHQQDELSSHIVTSKTSNISLKELKKQEQLDTALDTIVINNDFYFWKKKHEQSNIANYFDKFAKKPNVILIVCESLTYDFLDPNSSYSEVMPFLNKLSKSSLSWTNCFSTSERTFNVLPSIIGSLPYGEKGFNHLTEYGYPSYNNLVNILGNNGYNTSFSYGGWAYFDHMGYFLRDAGIDNMTEKFPEKFNQDSVGCFWGFPDKSLFKYRAESFSNYKKPSFEVFLTTSTHSPYHFPDFESYKEKINQLANSNNKNKKLLSNVDAFASFSYLDDALKEYFNAMLSEKEYQNTIFIITGDHKCHECDGNTLLNTYHVPLIVFSPKLKKPKEFKGITSHLDIAPSILSLINQNTRLKLPNYATWMGSNLNTSDRNEKNKFIPFMRVSREILDCIYGDYFYSNGKLFKISNNSILTRINDAAKTKEVKEKLLTFKHQNILASLNNQIQDCENLLAPIKVRHEFVNALKPKISKSFTLEKDAQYFVINSFVEIANLNPESTLELRIRIYETGKEIDYFIIKNGLVASKKYSYLYKGRNFNFGFYRKITDRNSEIFKAGRKIELEVVSSQSDLKIKDSFTKLFY
ncbi:MAG: hypothetical protein RLZZ546_3080, partial [Bacteroidota bacterium]